ncbi:cyclase family protein [Aureivirga sp. CE67]|uniref:cyclase family protein n=1 Tax=Aureivirga sp. CE67 TaxID=1788983 RepID=UPI0018CAF268|nr:cyclase family protein [Aureivirga sp. CE67]
MEIKINVDEVEYTVDLAKPIDISTTIFGHEKNPNAWYVSHPKIEPVVMGDFVGKVTEGSSTNFFNIHFNPHAHGTHTECIGHITEEFHSINEYLKEFHFLAELITINPEKIGEDLVITKELIEEKMRYFKDAIIIRTLPNEDEKLSKQYSNTNPAYLTEEAALFLREKQIKHLLIDLPSVDKERDEGKLVAHKAFWNYEGERRYDATITEFVYVPDAIEDGLFFMNLQIASFENDASPSKPILYQIKS